MRSFSTLYEAKHQLFLLRYFQMENGITYTE